MTKHKTAVLLPDLHSPYHDRRAWRLVLQVVRHLQPDEVIQLGDLTDQACTGRWAKDPRKVATFRQEVVGTNQLLDELDAAAPDARKTLTLGNHDARLELFLVDQAPYLLDLPGFSLGELLRLEERGYEVCPYKKGVHRGGLFLTHDVGRCGKRAHEQAVEDLGHSYAGGHTHNLAITYRGTIFGECRVGASLGWLGDVRHIGYKHSEKAKRDYQLGFGVLRWFDRGARKGAFSLVPVPIVDYNCCVDGEWFSEREKKGDFWSAQGAK